MAAISVAAPPSFADPYGTLRVQCTRVTLDSDVTAFRAGATAKYIAQKFPSVPLSDLHLIIANYLHHAADLSGQRSEAAALRQSTEHRFDQAGLRARLLARREPPARI